VSATTPEERDAMPVTLRAAASSDMDMLSGVFRRASLSNEDDRGYLLAHPEVLELGGDAVREGRTIVAEDPSGSVVGFASFLISGDVIELEDLFVDPACMKRGIGRRLVLAIVAAARELGFDRLEVTANPHAMQFYERTGFVADRVVETDFYPAPRMYRSTA
jgi:GNAT superfamily N-acetyltransferase